jgi:hypothetical protein
MPCGNCSGCITVEDEFGQIDRARRRIEEGRVTIMQANFLGQSQGTLWHTKFCRERRHTEFLS